MLKKVLQPKQQCVLELVKKIDILDKFYLAGGTAAALHLGHRKSDDFDFFSDNNFSPDYILEQLKSAKKEKEMLVVGQTKGSLHGNYGDTILNYLLSHSFFRVHCN